MILSCLNKIFWIPKVTNVIRRINKECLRCKEIAAKGESQLMAPIPSFRWTNIGRPFAVSAVDYAGPFETVARPGKTRNKIWLCLFTYLHIKAVHLEMAYGFDSSSFLKAYNIFVNLHILKPFCMDIYGQF